MTALVTGVVVTLSGSKSGEYLGVDITDFDLQPYLQYLRTVTSEKRAEELTGNQRCRDHERFHITIIAPNEMTALEGSADVSWLCGHCISFTLLGLGKIEVGDNQSYFVVAESSEAQRIRKLFGLKDRDFHITIGFAPDDIQDVRKDKSTLIDPSSP